ncbi:MAG: hypothetical protein K6F39_05460 [Lachnospiraceae bacterium]|nr:hypothetical protein [Lachnospiraceae bacterium]
MKLKYYLRGLGIGIVVTAIVMGISLGSKGGKNLTDDEIISRAKELGMTESNEVLSSPTESVQLPIKSGSED